MAAPSRTLSVVLAFAVIHALYMAFAVSKQSVVDASRTYARQLILSCETFIGKQSNKPAPLKKPGPKRRTT